MARTRWSKKYHKQAALLRSLGHSYRAIEREIGVPEATIRDWILSGKSDPEDPEIRAQKKKILAVMADDCLDIAQMAMERLREVIPTCKGVQQLSIATGTLIDKHNLINGDPTQIHKLDNLAELFNAVD